MLLSDEAKAEWEVTETQGADALGTPSSELSEINKKAS